MHLLQININFNLHNNLCVLLLSGIHLLATLCLKPNRNYPGKKERLIHKHLKALM